VAQEGNVASEDSAKTSVDPADEPSAEWGWHGSFPKATQVGGWIAVIALLGMLFGNHQGILSGGGHLGEADIWLIGIALVLAIGLVASLARRRKAWRR
jgi:hypothetical protein